MVSPNNENCPDIMTSASGFHSGTDGDKKTTASSKSRMESGETPDVGLGSSVCGEEPGQDQDQGTKSKSSSQSDNHHIGGGGSDSGQGSEADDGIRMAYHFYIPTSLCGNYIIISPNY